MKPKTSQIIAAIPLCLKPQPEGGFPKELQKIILKDEEPITLRPGSLLPDENFDEIRETCEITVKEGRVLVITLAEIGKVGADGFRTLVFEVDGNRRELSIKDKKAVAKESVTPVQTKDENGV